MGNEIGPFSTAVEMLAALDAKQISSVELVEMHLARIDKLDEALERDPGAHTGARGRRSPPCRRARARLESRAALLGLPMTLKESTQVAGLPQSAGIMPFKDYRPDADGPIARSVFAAGSCLLGKTNIPVALADWQADSPVYGRTNNPWDLERTPGGSTGGGGAALAAGFTSLEIGSDIGGSIRVPAAYCGVYGHRPSETALPRTGAFPLADRPNPAVVHGLYKARSLAARPTSSSSSTSSLARDVGRGHRRGGSTFPRRATIGWPTSASRSCRRCRWHSRRPRCRRRSTSSRRLLVAHRSEGR